MHNKTPGFKLIIISFLIVAASIPRCLAEAKTLSKGKVSLLIIGLGNDLDVGQSAIQLPGPIAYGINPSNKHAALLAEYAHHHQKTVLAAIAMEAEVHATKPSASKTLLLRSDSQASIASKLQQLLSQLPHVSGLCNIMGSAFMAEANAVNALLASAQEKNLLFVDLRTTARSQSRAVAKQLNYAFLERDVFIDHQSDRQAMEYQGQRLVALAKNQGKALAVAHARASTLTFLSTLISDLKKHRIEVVPLEQQ